MQLLVRHIYDKAATSATSATHSPRSSDECRHSKMFARMITQRRHPVLPGQRALNQNLGRLFKTISTTPGSFAAPCSARRSSTGCSG